MLPSIKNRYNHNKENQPSRRLTTEYVKRYPRSQSIREYQPKANCNHSHIHNKYLDMRTQQSDDEMPMRSPYGHNNFAQDLIRFRQPPSSIENEMKKIDAYQQKSMQAYLELIKVRLMQLNLR